MKKIEKPAETLPASTSKRSTVGKHAEIKMDHPLIEKDQVKQAEERMRQALKNNDN